MGKPAVARSRPGCAVGVRLPGAQCDRVDPCGSRTTRERCRSSVPASVWTHGLPV